MPTSEGIKKEAVMSATERAVLEAASALGAKVGDGQTAEETPTGDGLHKSPFEGIPEEDKQAFIRALQSGEKFMKNYELFRGVVKVTFTVMDEVDLAVVRQSSLQAGPEGSSAYIKSYAMSRFLYSIYNLTVAKKTLANGAEQLVTDMDLLALDSITYRALFQQFNIFEELCDRMFEIAADPNF